MSGLTVSCSSVKALVQAVLPRWFRSLPIRSKFTKARLPRELFAERSEEHQRFGGDPQQPHKLHIVTRVKSVMRRPAWEKEMVKQLGLQKAHVPVIHKNTPAVNNQLKFVKHLVRIQPLQTPFGLPAEHDMADTFINSKGELVVRRLLQPAGGSAPQGATPP